MPLCRAQFRRDVIYRQTSLSTGVCYKTDVCYKIDVMHASITDMERYITLPWCFHHEHSNIVSVLSGQLLHWIQMINKTHRLGSKM